MESQLDLECRTVLVCPEQADQGEPVALPVGPGGPMIQSGGCCAPRLIRILTVEQYTRIKTASVFFLSYMVSERGIGKWFVNCD